MGFGGSVLAMIQSLRANARPKHKAYQDWEKAENRRFHSDRKLVDKKVSQEKLLQIKTTNKKKIDREQKRNLIIKLLTLIVLIPLIIFAVFQFFFHHGELNYHPYQSQVEQHEEVLDNEQINYLLNSGFEWLNKNHYKNARFQFNRVLEVQPDNKYANYGLTATYVYECRIDGTNCTKAHNLLDNYITKNGKDQSVERLLEMLNE